MPKEIFHDSTFVMKKGYPKVTKLGAVMDERFAAQGSNITKVD